MALERLTDCEQLVMNIIWDTGEELSLMEIVQKANNKYNKAWKPQTVSTFLARLARKGYLKCYRKGRVFFYQVLIPLDEYKAPLTDSFINFWSHGNADEFLSTLMKTRPLRSDEIRGIRELLDRV